MGITYRPPAVAGTYRPGPRGRHAAGGRTRQEYLELRRQEFLESTPPSPGVVADAALLGQADDGRDDIGRCWRAIAACRCRRGGVDQRPPPPPQRPHRDDASMFTHSSPAEVMGETRQASPVVIVHMPIGMRPVQTDQIALGSEVGHRSDGLLAFPVGEVLMVSVSDIGCPPSPSGGSGQVPLSSALNPPWGSSRTRGWPCPSCRRDERPAISDGRIVQQGLVTCANYQLAQTRAAWASSSTRLAHATKSLG
jgi:hypothetical protein